MNSYIKSFVDLFYPDLCLACTKNLSGSHDTICISCQLKMPQTGFHHSLENPFTMKFWGRVPVHFGAAMYYYRKDSLVQNMIHQFKYGGKKQIGFELGRKYGRDIYPMDLDFDGIIPVPLHLQKERQRGFNQSSIFAKGLSETIGIPTYNNVLIRKEKTATQTKKSRLERIQNVLHAFVIKDPQKIWGKHILLVDDVLTTGATLEACALNLLEVNNVKISMATIAIASD